MSPDAYLLDTSIASIALDAGRAEHSEVRSRLSSFGDSTIWIPAITLGEVEYGLGLYSWLSPERNKAVRDRFSQYEVMSIDRSTGRYYGPLRAEIFRKYAPRDIKDQKKFRKGTQPEDLTDSTTAKSLGIQENDLWIVALAIEYNLRLITRDRMARILEVAREVHSYDRALVWLDL